MAIDILKSLFLSYGLVGAFGLIALIMLISYGLTGAIKQKRMGSAVAIIVGLVLAYIAGKITGGSKGLADIEIFAGVGLLGGSMLRDFTIISTAYGVKIENLKKAGLPGIVSLIAGIFSSFLIGAVVAVLLGYRDAAEITTIAGGAVTFIVGPVTGTALGVSSEVIALSIAAGVVKSVLTMIVTPFIAPIIKLDNPTAAMVYGGLIGTTSGVAGGLAATDTKLVPYGAMTATFVTGLGSLLVPSIGFLIIRGIFN
ncbi:malonate transporter, MadM subunit [Anaerovirgula multivorans]|uniref:Malonate transporter, MadM subunit n=1 Tax=Anaerovirgula multivorans TaxID=312168 RepID=A0A239FIP0_9FIRM|nr:malonate transporter subunit MadM [Anaerovirgula multivorans]SNS55924.1 malonate transporter, MadM subunit [Anaerovirgula multivorans]